MYYSKMKNGTALNGDVFVETIMEENEKLKEEIDFLRNEIKEVKKNNKLLISHRHWQERMYDKLEKYNENMINKRLEIGIECYKLKSELVNMKHENTKLKNEIATLHKTRSD